MKTINLILLIFLLVLVLVPFFWMVSTALKSEMEALKVPPSLVPSELHFENFLLALEYAPFLTYFANSLFVSVCVVLISTTVSVLAAYAFARLNFPGKNIMFFVVLASMMIPQEMLIITNFMTIAKLGWMNSYQALILPYCINAFNIFLLRQTIKQIPEDLYTAARTDGLGSFRYLIKVVLPIAKPTIITTMLLSLIWIWNTYAWPSLITTTDSLRMVSNGLRNAFTNSMGHIQYELQMAGATMVTIPLIIVFVCFRKYIFAGMSKAGTKG